MDARIRSARPDDIDHVLALWAHGDVEPTVTDDTPGDFWAACGYQAQTDRRRFVRNIEQRRPGSTATS